MDPKTHRYLDCNSAAASAYGFRDREETLGKTPLDVSSDIQYDGTPSPEKALFFIETALREGFVVFDWRHRRPDGTEWDAEVHLLRFEAEGEELLQFTLVDITERKMAADALKESESRFRVLFEQAGVGIIIVDEKERFIDCNQKSVALFGGTREQLLAASVLQLSPPRQPDGRASEEGVKEKISRAFSEGPQYFEWTHARFDGTLFETEIALNAVKTDQGTVLFGIIYDITARRRAEKEREHLREQLLQSQKMEAIGQLAGGVAHDFNNLLGVILGRTDMLLDELEDDHPLRADLMSILDATERSAALTRQLLTFARKQPVAPRALDMNDTVAGMLKMLRRLIGEGISLIWKPGENLGCVNMDPSQVDQILANLCVNARDAIDGVGEVVIETADVRRDDASDYVMLSVSDSGRGMPKRIQNRIFDPFFTTKSVGEGSGLGLSTVYGIVHQNGGTIEVASEPGHGASFRIYLPRTALVDHDSVSPPPTIPDIGKGKTALLIEDEPTLLSLAESMLEKIGFTVLSAGTPSESIALCQAHADEVDIVISDVIMPEMNGRELVEKLKVYHPGLKSLYISGYTADVIADHGVLDKGVHFLPKPFTLKALTSKVSEVLR